MAQNNDEELTLSDITEKIKELSAEVKAFNTRSADYHKATRWLVQLAFALIGSATITVIVTTVFKK